MKMFDVSFAPARQSIDEAFASERFGGWMKRSMDDMLACRRIAEEKAEARRLERVEAARIASEGITIRF
tara:strand:+ start:357 stop:563 length:207 start_codon:yes stop_codon:yes gene_type:complete